MTDESDLVFPLDKELSLTTMVQRLKDFSEELHAIREYRQPDPSYKLHVLAKDNIGVAGFPTSAGCKALENLFLPDAECIVRLRSKVDVFGKTNMSELAGFVSSVNSLRAYSEIGGFGVNPHGKDFLCGGSSSGSAISVAAGLCDAALGTETRGSLMFPGLLCGVYSFKPTRGAISRYGIIPLANSFDTPGILGRNIATIEYLYGLMKGYDPKDSLTNMSALIEESNNSIPSSLKIGLLRDPSKPGTAIDSKLLERLEKQDITVKNLQRVKFDNDYKMISSIEFKRDITSFLQTFATDGMPKSFDELLNYYETHPTSHPFGMDRLEDVRLYDAMEDDNFDKVVLNNITKANELIRQTMEEAKVDVLASESFVDWWSIGGGPTITVPLGVKDNGEPFGLMLGLLPYKDYSLLAIAKLLVQAVSFSQN